MKRSEPNAIAEFSGSAVQRFAGTSKNFEIVESPTQRISLYEDGTARLTDDPVTILVPKGDGRTFRITAGEVTVDKGQVRFELTGSVRLDDTDGFWLATDRATINRDDSTAFVPGTATFGKGRMSGSGIGFSYDIAREVLLVSQRAQVKTVTDAGKTVMQLASDSAMLDRLQHLLTLDTAVHVMRETQVIDADHASSRLSVDNDVVTFIELRGHSKVTGGDSIDAMSARDIDLDYTDDGQTLEAATLAGAAAIVMKGEAGNRGRGIGGETVDLALAPDGALTRAVARQDVWLELPAGPDEPQRRITAQALDASGEAGKGLTTATFTTDVSFTEQPGSATDSASGAGGARTARAQRLEASLADDAVTSATFTGGDVAFEEPGLKACAARLDYQPGKGTLALSGPTKAGSPIVAEEQVSIEGQAIDVALETRRMTAKGSVTTLMRAGTRCKPSAARPASERGASRNPSLLKGDTPVTIIATDLEYDGRTGYAVYTGSGTRRPRLDQGDTSLGADRLVIDQSKGDLTATGGAASQLLLDDDRMTGRAHEIRYTDDKRLISYSAAPGTRTGSPAGPGARSEVYVGSGPDNNLRASGRIDIFLAPKDNAVERMEAVNDVRVAQGAHVVTDGGRLKYAAQEGKYEVTSMGTTPVVLVTREGARCRETIGRSVTFFKGNDTVIIDGNDMSRVPTAPSKSACTPR